MKFIKFLEEMKEGQKEFGKDISAVINSVLLSLVYIFGVGVTSIIAKLSRKSFLDLKVDKNAPTYWQELNLAKKPIEYYYRQF